MVGERLYVTPHLILHTPHSILHTPHSTLSTPHSTLYTFHSTLCTLHLTLQTLHFTLCTLHFTLCPLTLHTLHFTLHTPPTTVTLHPLLQCNDPQPAGSSSTRSTNHLQHRWNCYPCFATLPQYHFSSPCKLSCSEPQRTLLSVEPLYTVHSHHSSHSPPPTVMILSPLVHRLLEAQTICSTFGIVILALQPFATPSSVSLLIPLQTLLFRTPTKAAPS